MKIYSAIFVLGFIVGALLLYTLFWPTIEESHTVIMTEKTKWVKKDTTIYHYKDTLVYNIVNAKPSPEPEKYDSIRTYRGLETFEYGSLSWEARTLGSLGFVKFTPTINIPTTIKTVEKESTKIIKTKALYLQSSVSTNYKFEIGASYIFKDVIASYSYSPSVGFHRIGVGIKILGK